MVVGVIQLRTKLAFGVPITQTALLLAHWFLWYTWAQFVGPAPLAVRIILVVLAFSFFPSAALSFRMHPPAVRMLYFAAVLWLGILNYLFWAAVMAWVIHIPLLIFHLTTYDKLNAELMLAFALCTIVYGIIHSRLIKIRRHWVHLPNLPKHWHGRRVALVSDTHFGAINGALFSRRVVGLLKRLHPELVLIAGDLFDGAGIDPALAMEPWKELKPKYGICFATGNHEEFGDRTPYLKAMHDAGLRILDPNDIPYLQHKTDSAYITSALVDLDGLQVAGIGFHDSTHQSRLRTTLSRLGLDPSKPSILINHVPNQLPVIEQAGISLMVSGHTHGGQLFPFTLIVKSIFGPFARGYARFGKLQTLTCLGTGTWGPPMRVGTRSEILLIELADEKAAAPVK
jgi:predicted MPP superfamily phosphohydrolase